MGPEPTLIGRKQVEALYDVLEAVKNALNTLEIPYVITGGSLLGAVRQHSILFCDDDVDIAIIQDSNGTHYQTVQDKLQELLGPDYSYSVKPWEGGDRIRKKSASNVFVDLFCIREYKSEEELRQVIGIKKNGQSQSESYVNGITQTMQDALGGPLFPCWHFDTRKAMELWQKEVYRKHELFPLDVNYKMGPVTDISGPRMPVLLLKRAFGNDCFDVYYQSHSHDMPCHDKSHHSTNGDSTDLKPIVAAGGTWESNVKMPLQDEQYIPMQPISRAKRRPTLHNKERLGQYLEQQSAREARWMEEYNLASTPDIECTAKPRRTVYMDGVFDLFHKGHLRAIQQCAELGDRVIIGVTGDEDAADYKRPPIISQTDRIAVVEAIRNVDKVICPCPLIVTQDFMEVHEIDLVVHGFANDEDAERQQVFFEYPIKMRKFQRIGYYKDLSTTEIIGKIQSIDKEQLEQDSPNKRFGVSLAAATKNAATIPYDPFPLELRSLIESHIRRASTRRNEALSAIRIASCLSESDFNRLIYSRIFVEDNFTFDTEQYPLRDSLLKCVNLDTDSDLARIHFDATAKDSMMRALTGNFREFQAVFDDFVLSVCAPRMSSCLVDCDRIYYQGFPCIRVVQPGEYSIGPHADVTYGHHPCTVNFYVPLTQIGGTSSLYLESRHGSEDWHPIVGDYGIVKQFAGATCLHWTPENMMDYTRVSLDFRLIAGSMYDALSCGGEIKGGQVDTYRKSPGYYSCCRKRQDGTWEREGDLLSPDARVGFPWTIKDWKHYIDRKMNGAT
jgi:cytidyltransferase-like protein